MPKNSRRSRALTVVADDASGRLELTLAGLTLVEDMAARGCPQSLIARALGVSESTLKEFRKRDDRVDAAWTTGRGRLEQTLWGVLIEEAKNPESKMRVVSAIAALKMSFGYRDSGADRTAVQVNVGRQQGGVLVVPQQCTREEFEARWAGIRTPSIDAIDVPRSAAEPPPSITPTSAPQEAFSKQVAELDGAGRGESSREIAPQPTRRVTAGVGRLVIRR